MIQFENFTFSYGDLQTPQLRDFHFVIHPGECVLLCGASACGKTTAAKCINGLIPHFTPGKMTGSVWLNGAKVADTPTYVLAEHVGSVFQNPKTQFFNLDSTSELVFGMENLGIPAAEMHRRADQAAEDLKIKNLLGRRVFDLSGGEKQILALASVYAVNPDIYVLDEPSANMDEAAMMRLHQILKKLKAMGKTLVISEHRLYFLMDLIDRAIYMQDGRISQIYTGDAFRSLCETERISMGLRCFSEPRSPFQISSQCTEGLLQIQDLTIKAGKKTILQNLSFSADPGDIIAVTGANGSGKTALLRTLCGLAGETAGSVICEGRRCSKKERRDLCAMTMQDVAHQLFADSVEEEFSLLNCKIKETEISSILDRLELTAHRKKHPMTLSGGQKQRLAIAAASLSGKKILIFDEPTSGLDYGNMCRVSRLIKDMAEERIIFVATHDRELLNMLCTRQLCITGQSAAMTDFTADPTA